MPGIKSHSINAKQRTHKQTPLVPPPANEARVSQPQNVSHKRILCKFDVPLEHFLAATFRPSDRRGPLSSLSGSLIEWPLSAFGS